ncbi:MAG: MATE family efflux transporter [Eubacteriaceae bacterium]
MDNEKLHILGEMPVKNAILKLAIPTMMGMIIQTVYNLTDTFFIGKLNDPNQVAAISICFPIFMIIQALGNLFSTGGASFISRMLGEKEYEKANKGAAISYYSSIIMAVFTSIVILIFINPIINMIGASDQTFQLAKEYLIIIAVFSFVLVLQVSLSGILRAEGGAKEAMNGMVLGTLINIVLDPIFILGFDMGVNGAAIATVIGNAVGVAYFLSIFIRQKSILRISWKYFSFDKTIYADILKIGAPASLSNILMSVVSAYSNFIAASYGDVVVASFGIVMRISSMAFMLVFGLALGYQPLAGYCYGSKDYTRLMKGLKVTVLYGTYVALFFAVVTFIFSKQLIMVFIGNVEVIEIGSRIMRAFAIPMPFIGIQMTIMVSFQAMGKGMQSLIISIGRQGLFFLPALILLNKYFGLNGFICAQPMADFLTTFLSLGLFVALWRKMQEEMHNKDIKIN